MNSAFANYTYCSSQKKAYPTKERANKAVTKYNKIHKELGDRLKQFPYECKCGSWHLTSIKPKDYRKIKKKIKRKV